MTSTKRIVVIGAGIGGLTTAALLARAGHDVTVLEAHVYPGGCAGTFFHQGYRFDAGATLAGGFYPGGPMDIVARRLGIDSWPSVESEPAMTVSLPAGPSVTRYGDERRWAERAPRIRCRQCPILALAGRDGRRALGLRSAYTALAATRAARDNAAGRKRIRLAGKTLDVETASASAPGWLWFCGRICVTAPPICAPSSMPNC